MGYTELKKWLDMHPVVRFALARVVVALLGALLGVLGTLGLVEPQLAAQLAAVLGL